jgi:oligopeptide transport system ATP-binding protein
MYAGKIVERGASRDIFYRPRHPYTLALLASVPRLDMRNKSSLAYIKGMPPDLLAPPGGCPFAERCAYQMRICSESAPEPTFFGDGHEAACWLHDPAAPEISWETV